MREDASWQEIGIIHVQWHVAHSSQKEKKNKNHKYTLRFIILNMNDKIITTKTMGRRIKS